MPEDSGAGEKTEEATPKKRDDARNEGQVAFSTEVNTICLLLIGCGLMMLFGPLFYTTIGGIIRLSVSDLLHVDIDDHRVISVLVMEYARPFLLFLGFLGVLFLSGMVLSLAQVGIRFTLKPLVPKASRISPAQGLKRIFGTRGMVKTLFSVLKLTLIISVAWWILSRELLDQLYYDLDPAARFADTMWLLVTLALRLVGVMAVVAVADFLYQRYQHSKDLMMTKQEVKEELKQSDGDPLIKSRIRQLQRQMAMGRMMQEVPKADVVITNPTHVAVALRYVQDEMEAPVVVAKGYDLVAQRIKRIAAEHDIIQVENVALARALAKECRVGAMIPVSFFQQVAEVLGYVYRLRKDRSERRAG